MRIHPPKPAINLDAPFAEALFGRKGFADSLTALLRNVPQNLVVIVNAPWGDGKTTFAEMWRTDLSKQGIDVIYFDAYAADYCEDPFVSFSGEILGLVEKHLKAKGRAEKREFKKTAVEVGKRLAGIAIKAGVRAASMGAVDATQIEHLRKVGLDIVDGVSDVAADLVEKRIASYTAEKDSMAAFKQSLTNLAAVVREEVGFPLAIIVDELDRCRPDFALGLLERIKHLFDVPGVAFILLVNREQIETYIRTVYGEVDAATYLLKFANVFVDLPNQNNEFAQQYEKGRGDYCRQLLHHYEIQARDGAFLHDSLGALVEHFDLTLREIDNVFTVLALYYSSLPQNQFTNSFLIPLLAVLKVKRPEIYAPLSKGRLPLKGFLDQTSFEAFNSTRQGNVNEAWVKDLLKVCLSSDSDLQKAIEEPQNPVSHISRLMEIGARANLEPQKIIPFLCSRLDAFSVMPY